MVFAAALAVDLASHIAQEGGKQMMKVLVKDLSGQEDRSTTQPVLPALQSKVNNAGMDIVSGRMVEFCVNSVDALSLSMPASTVPAAVVEAANVLVSCARNPGEHCTTSVLTHLGHTMMDGMVAIDGRLQVGKDGQLHGHLAYVTFRPRATGSAALKCSETHDRDHSIWGLVPACIPRWVAPTVVGMLGVAAVVYFSDKENQDWLHRLGRRMTLRKLPVEKHNSLRCW